MKFVWPSSKRKEGGIVTVAINLFFTFISSLMRSILGNGIFAAEGGVGVNLQSGALRSPNMKC